MTPGQRLRELRKARNLTQRDIAEHLGITSSAVGQWETDRTKPQWTQIEALDEFVGAGGEILHVYGMGAVGGTPISEISRLVEAVERLAQQQRDLAAVVEQVLDQLQPGASDAPRPDSGRGGRAASG